MYVLRYISYFANISMYILYLYIYMYFYIHLQSYICTVFGILYFLISYFLTVFCTINFIKAYQCY